VRRFRGALSAEVAPSAWLPTCSVASHLPQGCRSALTEGGKSKHDFPCACCGLWKKTRAGDAAWAVCLRVTRYVCERKLDTRVRSCFANRGLCLSTADSTGFECRICILSCSSLVGPSRQEASYSSVDSYGYCKFNQTPTKVPAQTPALALRLPYRNSYRTSSRVP
jgi:hypothetical protein